MEPNLDDALAAYLADDEPTAIMSPQRLRACLQEVADGDAADRAKRSGVRAKVTLGSYSRVERG